MTRFKSFFEDCKRKQVQQFRNELRQFKKELDETKNALIEQMKSDFEKDLKFHLDWHLRLGETRAFEEIKDRIITKLDKDLILLLIKEINKYQIRTPRGDE